MTVEFGTIVILDCVACSCVGTVEIFMDRTAAEDAMGRRPDVVGDDLQSWGDVSPTELARLFDAAGDREGAALVEEVRARRPDHESFVSIYWRALRD